MTIMQVEATDPTLVRTVGIVTVMLGAFLAAVLYPVARAYARRMDRPGDAAGVRDQLAEVSARLEEMQRGQDRMAELEERLDFAERMLAQQREPARLPGERPAP